MSFSAWIPSETRLTPALLKPRKREASTLVGLASSEISTSGARLQCLGYCGAKLQAMKFRVLQDNLRKALWERIDQGDLTGIRLARQTGFKQAHISNFLNKKRGLSLEGMDKVLPSSTSPSSTCSTRPRSTGAPPSCRPVVMNLTMSY